jgi:outer membrane protein assembly factor BamB
MRVVAGAVVAAVVACVRLVAQPARPEIFTRPDVPPREALDRLNLRLAWRTYVPMDGMRDGLVSVQPAGPDLLVLTRSGHIILMNAENGETRWRTRVGIPYRTRLAPAINSRTVLVVNNVFLYALSRSTGQVQWQFRLPGGVSAPLAAGEDAVYVPGATGRFYKYFLPRMEFAALVAARAKRDSPLHQLYEKNKRTTGSISHFSQSVRDAGEEVVEGPQPLLAWEAVTGLRLESRPLIGHERVVAVGAEGTAVGFDRNPTEGGRPHEIYRFDTEAPINVPPGQFGDAGYIGAQDANVYALNLVNGRVLWRFTSGEAISHRPVALEQDVFLAAGENGLSRLDRATGESMWRVARGPKVIESNVEAKRFLAANTKFVYAQDRLGRLMVLDRRLGHTLSVYDVRDFVFPVSNEITDRLYLAANSGLIVCLHDKEYTAPIRHHRILEQALDRMRTILATPITDPGGNAKQVTLAETLDALVAKYNIKFSIADRAFRDLGLEPIGPKLVIFPKVEKKPLGEVIQDILTPMGATYEIVEDTILIIPGVPEPGARMP